jgi:GDP-4-dehydro-6-deoxy-D-mannose reductase
MEQVLERLLALARVRIEARLRPGLVRAAENLVVRANATRLRNEIGWQPRFTLEQSLLDTLDYWRGQP